jgi:hypothetical protein
VDADRPAGHHDLRRAVEDRRRERPRLTEATAVTEKAATTSASIVAESSEGASTWRTALRPSRAV